VEIPVYFVTFQWIVLTAEKCTVIYSLQVC